MVFRNGLLLQTTQLLLLWSWWSSPPCALAYHAGILDQLKQAYPGWSPNAIVDIGANAGEWSKLARNHFPNAKLLLLEATPKHNDTLKAVTTELGNAEHQIAVLTGRTGDTVEFYQGGDTGNSMFKEDSHHYANQQPVQRTTIKLDDALQQSFLKSLPAIDYIKIDVQGAELLVLEGGEETLAGASFVQLESGTTEYNPGGSCFYDVDEWLREHGFYWYDIADINKNEAFKTLGLGQFDVLYVKPTSTRLPTKFRELDGTFCGMRRPKNQALYSFMRQYGLEHTVPDVNVSGWWGGFACGALSCAVMIAVAKFATGAPSKKTSKDLL